MGPDLGASLVREALSFTHDHGIDTQGEAMQEEPGGSFQAQGRAGGLFPILSIGASISSASCTRAQILMSNRRAMIAAYRKMPDEFAWISQFLAVNSAVREVTWHCHPSRVTSIPSTKARYSRRSDQVQ